MFKRIKNSLRDSKKLDNEQITPFNFKDKPFSEALISRGQAYQKEATQDLKKMVGTIRPITKREILEEVTSSCAITIAYHATTEAMKAIGYNTYFNPCEVLPKYAPITVAFSLIILCSIKDSVDTEGIELNIWEMVADTANLFFIAYPDDERKKHALDAIETFQFLVRADEENVEKWRTDLSNVALLYILQWTTDDQKLKTQNLLPIFGKQLLSLLRTIE